MKLHENSNKNFLPLIDFGFWDMQIDSFAFLSLASIIMQLESALNSLYQLYSDNAKSIHYFVWNNYR